MDLDYLILSSLSWSFRTMYFNLTGGLKTAWYQLKTFKSESLGGGGSQLLVICKVFYRDEGVKTLTMSSIPFCRSPENLKSSDLLEARSWNWTEKASVKCVLFLFVSPPHSQVTSSIPIIELDTESPGITQMKKLQAPNGMRCYW